MCAHVSRHANSMCLSVFLSSTFHICHSASPAVQHLIQMRLMNIHIIWQSALKRLLYISLFILLTWKWWIIFLNKLYLYSARTKYINNGAFKGERYLNYKFLYVISTAHGSLISFYEHKPHLCKPES